MHEYRCASILDRAVTPRTAVSCRSLVYRYVYELDLESYRGIGPASLCGTTATASAAADRRSEEVRYFLIARVPGMLTPAQNNRDTSGPALLGEGGRSPNTNSVLYIVGFCCAMIFHCDISGTTLFRTTVRYIGTTYLAVLQTNGKNTTSNSCSGHEIRCTTAVECYSNYNCASVQIFEC